MPSPSTASPGGAPVRMAVMGAGRWGSNVVRTLAATDGARLLWVADPDLAARERADRVEPSLATCESIDEALDDVEAVFVCTPSEDHFEHARYLLEAGKHLLVEKPLSLEVAQAEQLADIADRAGLTLMVGHQLLFHPLFRRQAELVAAGTVGPLRSLRAWRTGRVDFAREPDVLWAYAPHDVALVLHLTGELPSAVRAVGWLDPDCAAVRSAEIELSFPGGVRAAITLDGATDDRKRLLTASGERAAVEFDDSMPGGRLALLEEGVAEPLPGSRDLPSNGEPLALECRHFVEAVRRGSRPLTHGRHAVDVVRIIENIAAGIHAELGVE